MKYVIKIIVNTKPDKAGWSDFLSLSVGGSVVYSCMCRATPNPYRPSTGKRWMEEYGVLAPQVILCETIHNHPKFGTWVLFNAGSAVRARFPNPNSRCGHVGERILKEVGLHESWAAIPNNPGSAGCPTVPKGFQWDEFLKHLPDGEGVVIIEDNGVVFK